MYVFILSDFLPFNSLLKIFYMSVFSLFISSQIWSCTETHIFLWIEWFYFKFIDLFFRITKMRYNVDKIKCKEMNETIYLVVYLTTWEFYIAVYISPIIIFDIIWSNRISQIEITNERIIIRGLSPPIRWCTRG